jgi:hypothetical protein
MTMPQRSRALFVTASIAALAAAAYSAGAQPRDTLPPHTIVIAHWPEDVPCNVLKKYPDGTNEITVPYMLYYQLHSSTKLRNLRVTRYWDRKCAGRTQ